MSLFECVEDDGLTINGNYIKLGEPKIDGFEIKYEYVFFGRHYGASIWMYGTEFRTLCYLARKGIVQLHFGTIKNDVPDPFIDFLKVRRRICDLCHACRAMIISSDVPEVKPHLLPSVKLLLNHVYPLKYLPNNAIFDYGYTNREAAHNYIHLLLDMYLFRLTTEYCFEEDNSRKLEVFEQNLTNILTDLIYVSVKKFEKDEYIHCNDLSKQSPFVCSCYKELWLLIQLLIEKLYDQQFCKDFWYYFNSTVMSVINLENIEEKNVVCLWLLYHVAKIQGYNSEGINVGPVHGRITSNYILIEQCFKSIINNPGKNDEEIMSTSLHYFGILQTKWWTKDASYDLLQLLWEYFYKRLNTSFSATNGTMNFNINCEKLYDYCTTTETIRYYDFESKMSLNSYELFLSILGKYLLLNPIHWPKLKGRIYSKLSLAKLATMNDTGLHNLVLLFFTVAFTVNFNELVDKLQSLFNQLPVSRCENSNVIWSAQISILISRVNLGLSLSSLEGTELCAPILKAAQHASGNRSQGHVMRIFVEGLKKLLDCDPDLKYEEYILFDGWINNYMQWCSHLDACYLIELLKNLVEKIHKYSQLDWWTTIESNVVPSIIRLTSIQDPLLQITEFAASLVAIDSNRFKNILNHICCDNVNISVCNTFLMSLFKQGANVEEIANKQNVLFQAWIRVAILNTNKSDLAELTALIRQLPKFSSVFGSEFSSDGDPLYEVIRLAGVRMREAKSMQESGELKQWFETYFGKMDHWIKPIILGAEKGEDAQLIMRTYTIASLLFLHCSPGLYVKNQSSCLLYRLTSSLLLPNAGLINKKPPNMILIAIKSTWHLFVRGIVRLDFQTDTYIERILKDMVIRYIPHLNDPSSPITRCLDVEFTDSATKFMLTKIATILISCKSKNVHEHSLSALKIVLEMSRFRNNNVSKILLFAEIILPSVFEQLIFSEDSTAKHIVIEILENMISSEYYPQFRDTTKISILTVVEKHLPFSSANVFRFFESIGNLLQSEIREILPNLTEVINKVECMRGVAYDKNLRQGLTKIQDIVKEQCYK